MRTAQQTAVCCNMLVGRLNWSKLQDKGLLDAGSGGQNKTGDQFAFTEMPFMNHTTATAEQYLIRLRGPRSTLGPIRGSLM